MNKKHENLTNTTGMAMQRTDLTFKRTRMDNERTLISWLRTGLAITGFGVIIPRLVENIEPEWLVELIAALFVIVGLVMIVVGIRNYRGTASMIPEEEKSIPWWGMATIAGVIQVGAIVILILFILD